jgi:hypothetical protein
MRAAFNAACFAASGWGAACAGEGAEDFLAPEGALETRGVGGGASTSNSSCDNNSSESSATPRARSVIGDSELSALTRWLSNTSNTSPTD